MKKINVLKPKFRTKEILTVIEECLDKGWTGMGFKTVKFEEAWKNYTNLPHAHFIIIVGLLAVLDEEVVGIVNSYLIFDNTNKTIAQKYLSYLDMLYNKDNKNAAEISICVR